MNKAKLATAWLDGCSGCHMSILDVDERLIGLAQRFALVYSPLVDVKEFPDSVDVTLVEGAVSSEEDLHKLQKIRELGARISIDDFGTGFCSFSYLLQYQVDRLKIDQSFVKKAVTDTNAAAVVRTIIAMSHGLNIRVVAEGVETDEQLRLLLRRKCDEAQGTVVARPVPAREFCATVHAYSSNLSVLQTL